jgi:hypothetical protein
MVYHVFEIELNTKYSEMCFNYLFTKINLSYINSENFTAKKLMA